MKCELPQRRVHGSEGLREISRENDGQACRSPIAGLKELRPLRSHVQHAHAREREKPERRHGPDEQFETPA